MIQSATVEGTTSSSCIGHSSSSDSRESADFEIEGLVKTFAKCKWFNVAKGYGFVSLDDPTTLVDVGKTDTSPPDVFVYQTAIKMPGFRSLREGERVEVWYKKSDKGLEAVKVAGPEGSNCKGSEKRPKRRNKVADRCYNCDERGHHAKECNLPPLPKRCHHCKAIDHLVADCTIKKDKPVTSSSNNTANSDAQRASDTSQKDPESSTEQTDVCQKKCQS